MRVFVVWEPILKSDFMAPTTGALRRIAATRARHYWDEDQVLAKVMKRDARPPQPKHECCESDGVLWDLVAIYPKGARWETTLPSAVLFDGPVGEGYRGDQRSTREVSALDHCRGACHLKTVVRPMDERRQRHHSLTAPDRCRGTQALRFNGLA